MHEGLADEVKKNQTAKLNTKLFDLIKRKREEWKEKETRLRILGHFEGKKDLIISYFCQKKWETVSRIQLSPDTSRDEKFIVVSFDARN